MPNEYEIFDGRKVAPMLRKISKEKHVPFQMTKRVFIEKFAKGSEKRLEKRLNDISC